MCLIFPKLLSAQGPLEPPGDTRPKLPPFEPKKRERSNILPPLPMIPTPGTEALASGVKIYIHEIRITGNTVITHEEISPIIAPYQHRKIAVEDIRKLRDEITLAYVNRGYISSGAIIPKQSIADGILEVTIVEGQLAEVHVETDGRFREQTIRNRILRREPGPANVFEIEEQLQFLQQDPRTRYIEAELAPGEQRGESILDIHLYEKEPYQARFEASNYQSPAIGSWRGVAEVDYLNLTGLGDELGARFQFTEGLREVAGHYDLPLNARSTKLSLYARTAESEIVEDPFERLDIESNTQTYGLTLEQPIYRTIQTQVGAFLTGEWRRSKSFLDGSGFSFIEDSEEVVSRGSEEGVSKIAVLRAGFHWIHRNQRQVLAASTTFSLGLDTLDATTAGGDRPDGQFFSWLGQAQWARRFDLLDSQLIIRFDSQLSESPLLGLEQFALGGHSTVRGYRENTLVRDNGVIGSIELRVPIIKRRSGDSILEIAPFFDWGRSWNTDREEVGPKTLASLGMGARFSPKDNLYFQLHWAEDVKEIDDATEHDLQDEGIHISITWEFP